MTHMPPSMEWSSILRRLAMVVDSLSLGGDLKHLHLPRSFIVIGSLELH